MSVLFRGENEFVLILYRKAQVYSILIMHVIMQHKMCLCVQLSYMYISELEIRIRNWSAIF